MASGDLAVIWASARGEHSFPNVIGSYVPFISPCLLWFCLKNNMCPVCISNAFFVQEKKSFRQSSSAFHLLGWLISVYTSQGLQVPVGLQAHFTCCLAAS